MLVITNKQSKAKQSKKVAHHDLPTNQPKNSPSRPITEQKVVITRYHSQK